MARSWRRNDEPGNEDEAGGEEARARAFWSGTLSFGLVNVPVALFPATRGGRAQLRMLAPDGTPLERRWYCPRDERTVPWEELARGYELEDGSFVVLTDEELESAAPEKSRDIDLRLFTPREDLDPIRFERGYVLVPAEESTKAYRLLAESMEETGLAGVATFVMRTREYLIAIVSEGGVLRAETLRWAGEVRAPDAVDLAPPPKADGGRTQAIGTAIAELEADALDERELEDPEAAALDALVARKLRSGEDVREIPEDAAHPSSDPDVIDLMQVLKRSLEGERAPKREDLDALTRTELYERARDLEIAGRSRMTRPELIAALRKAG